MDKSKMAAWVNPRWHLSSSLDRCVGLICARILVVYWDVKGFKGINNQYDICQRESDTVMSSQRFSEFTVLYDNYLDYLHGSNGKLSSFWMSYMVEILLNFLRASREETGSYIYQPLEKWFLGVLLTTILTMLVNCRHMSLRCLTLKKNTLSNI